MGLHDSTKNKAKVGFLVNQMLDSLSSDDNTEVLIYRDEEGEWQIKMDRPFFSLGYMLKDENERLREENARLKQQLRRIASYPYFRGEAPILRKIAREALK
ncbi:hypothetical protein P4S93_01200 [Aneurinibacillus thermoaerophilus]|uniref:Uncharacterized protein n=1 Tax=Aneurinibacillus thermoaerophilus TaxID=143495 RepID=A0A1G8FSN6_ANETH|nr:hypothetical protein [Aneurinibacillus thermoaerophilus]MED0759149.1 hypothetical protein [Aneurinibacillus thermoaerophilus]MED0759407.1 hypothetical protein [Aneurinibacillus thermoaerophilus]SDH85117.1 hypothetical protein SAMN04489735_10823 [Aneurinibacillus thermoaerophilus]